MTLHHWLLICCLAVAALALLACGWAMVRPADQARPTDCVSALRAIRLRSLMMLLIVAAIATGARGRLAAEPESDLLALRAPDAEQPVYLNGDSRLTLFLRQEQMAQRAAGYQAFLSFDAARLRFVAGEYTSSPYGMWILVPIVASGGDLNLASGILPSHQLPSDETADLASLVFEPVGVEGAACVVFRNNSPPTRFTDDQGEPLDTHTLDSPTIIIDTTPPTIGCPPDITRSNDIGHPYATISVEAPPATDSLSGVESVVGIRSDGRALNDPYPVGDTTIGWTARDRAGNTAVCTQAVHVIDNRPIIVLREDDIRSNWRVPYAGLDGLSGMAYGKLKRIPITWGVICTGAAPGGTALSYAEIKDYLDAAGGEAASHSYRHQHEETIEAYIDELVRSKADIEANLPGYSCTTFLQPGAWGTTSDSNDLLHANIDMYAELDMPIGWAIAANYQQSMAYIGSGWRIGDVCHRHGTTNIFSIDYQSRPTVQSINATLDVVAATPGLIFIVSCHGVQERGGTAAYNVQADILKAFMDRAADLRDWGKVRLMGLHDAFHTDFSDDLNLVPDPGFELCQPGWLNPAGPWQLLRSAVISPDEGVGGSRCLKLTGPGARAESYTWLLRPGTYDLSWQQNVGSEAPSTSTIPSVGNVSSTAAADSRAIVHYPQIVSQEPGIWRTKTVRLLIKQGRPLATFRIELPGNASQSANVRIDDISLARVPTDPAVEPSAVTISPEPTSCTVSWLTPVDPTVTSISCRYGFNTHPLSTTEGASGGSIQAVPGTRQQLSFPINWTGRYAVFLSLFAARDGVVSGPVVDYLIVDGSAPSLNDPIVTAQSDSSVLASWQSSDAQSSVFDSWFAVGRSEGSSDLVGWTSTRSCSVEIDHLPTGTLHFSVYTRNPFGAKSVTKSVRFVMGTAQTIAYARSQPDGSWVAVQGMVTAIFADSYYIESANRANGIRVGGVCPVEMGSEIVVPGTLTTIDGERAVVPD